jgi:HEPN domain-containing protein
LNNLRMAESYLNQAGERLKHAEEALQRGNYPYVMRQSQEAVELSLKAALRVAGIEPPKWHDVGPILMQNRDRFPEWFKDKIPKIASMSRKLRREREASMYGDEETGLPPESLYTDEDAKEALSYADFVYEACRRLLEAVKSK